MTSFLERIKARFSEGVYAGDQYGGVAGADGSGLPDGSAGAFRFASGIECSYPTIKGGTSRRDQMEECGHYARWREDFAIVEDLGLKCLRYGLPLHLVCAEEGRYDWSFADAALAELIRLGIEPMLDLMHFGVPKSWGDYQNTDLPLLFADYCGRVAERYPWVRCFTPVNEIYVTARNSAKDGLWNEELKDDRSFVIAMKHIVAASILGAQAIAARRRDCIIVQRESAECMHQASPSPSPQVILANKLRFLSLDLLYAHAPDAEAMLYLLDNGLTRDEYTWFMAGEPPGYQVMGTEYYGRNEKIMKPNGEIISSEDVYGWREITKEYYSRYKKPVFLTETNTFDPEAAPQWRWKQWVNVLAMRDDGAPVLGFTCYSLTDQIDWDSQLAEQNGSVTPCGLYDLDRMLLEHSRRISVIPHAELLTISDKPARLKAAV